MLTKDFRNVHRIILFVTSLMEFFGVKCLYELKLLKNITKGVNVMSKEYIHELIVEAADRIYNSSDSPVSRTTELLMAEFYDSIEQLLTEVIYELYNAQMSAEKESDK